jgi:hypothetical protein
MSRFCLLTSLALVAMQVTHAEGLVDPTRPATYRVTPAATAVSESALRVEAIKRSGERYIAIVNGKLVRPGDRVGSAVIQRIEQASVHYSQSGRTLVARLPGANISVRGERTEVGQ